MAYISLWFALMMLIYWVKAYIQQIKAYRLFISR